MTFKKGEVSNPKGRPIGPNKLNAEIKAMVKGALIDAGGQQYLVEQAHANPKAFLTLVAKLMPAAATININTDPEVVRILNGRRDELAAKRDEIMKLIEHEPAAE